jgi:hypothetical protein
MNNKILAKDFGPSSFAKSYIKNKQKVCTPPNNYLYKHDGHLKSYQKSYQSYITKGHLHHQRCRRAVYVIEQPITC